MENASKALIMAGEVLIGVIILSILVLMFNKISEFTESYYANSETQKMIAFNAQFTKYITNNTDQDATYIYSEDVVSIVNQVLNWNRTVSDDIERITVTISTNEETIVIPSDRFDSSSFLSKYKLRENPSIEEYAFSCNVSLNETTGRVSTVDIVMKGL